MSYFEGILITNDYNPNAAAIGAKIDDNRLGNRIYLPSDTGRKLDDGVKFTYSLTTDPKLFYKAALTGHNEPEEFELREENLKKEKQFIFPLQATKTYFCEVKNIKIITEKDKYGEADIKLVESEILEERGTANYIGREEPLVDAMVHASRIHVADKDQEEQIRKKVKSVLEDTESDLKGKILDFIER